MAFYHTSGSATGLDDLIGKLKDALVAGGWSVYDDQWIASGYYIMFNSGGEEGLVPFYMELLKVGTNVIALSGYLAHPGGGGAGTGKFSGSSNTYYNIGTDTSTSYWITASKDGFVLATQQGATQRGAEFAILYPYLGINNDGTLQIAQTTSPVSAGGPVVIPVDDASFFQANNKYIVRQSDTVEKVTVTSVGANDITVSSLANSYSSGAFIGRNPVPIAISQDDMGLYWYEAITATATVNASGIAHQTSRNSHPAVLYGDPDAMSSLNHLYPVYLVNTQAANQGMRYWNRFTRQWGGTTAQGDTMPVGSQIWVGFRAANLSWFMRQS